MMPDKNLMFWDDNTTWTGAPSDSYALAVTGKDEFRAGEPVELIIAVTTVAGGTFNIDINLVTASASNLTTNQAIQKTLFDGITALAVGTYKFAFNMPVADADATHIGLDVVVNSGTVTGLVASAWLQRPGDEQHTIND